MENRRLVTTNLQKIHILSTYFKGREDHYALQFKDRPGYHGGDTDNLTGDKKLRGAISVKDWLAHLRGDITIGQYAITKGGQVHWLAVDLDNEETSREELSMCLTILEHFQLRSVVEESSPNRFHIWIFLDVPISATIAHSFGMSFKAKAFGKIKREFYPKQGANHNSWGNLLRLPWSKHQLKGTWSQLDWDVNADYINDSLRIAELDQTMRRSVPRPELIVNPPNPLRNVSQRYSNLDTQTKQQIYERLDNVLALVSPQELVAGLLGLKSVPKVGDKIKCPFHSKGENGSSGQPSFMVGGHRMPNSICWSPNCRLSEIWLDPLKLTMEITGTADLKKAIQTLEELAGINKLEF